MAATIEDQIQKLTADLAALAKTVAAAGSDRASVYQAKAGRYANEAFDRSRDLSLDALEELRAELGSLEKAVVSRVRAHPLQAIGIVGGIALLFALANRR